MVKQRLSVGLVLLTAMSMFAAANCDSGDAVVSVNVGYDSTAMDVQTSVASLHITISPKSGGGTAVTADLDVTHDDAGAITSAVYKRVTVNGLSGTVDVSVEARDSSGSPLLTATTTADLVQHGAVAAFVKFTRAAMTDAGGTDAGESTDSGAGSGGAVGSGGTIGSGGTVGQPDAGEAGGAVGSGGATSAGGAKGSGGTTGSGGATSTGGAKGSGGTTGSGGLTADGATGAGGNRGTGGA